MAIEDHPKHPEWRAALETYVQTFDTYKEAIRKREPQHIVRAARNVMILAQNKYFAVSDEIDYA